MILLIIPHLMWMEILILVIRRQIFHHLQKLRLQKTERLTKLHIQFRQRPKTLHKSLLVPKVLRRFHLFLKILSRLLHNFSSQTALILKILQLLVQPQLLPILSVITS
eukprot:NODE_73_length_24441_cov_0.672952.p22 type:complete len:108 gc:universal NODE_73_length_24441_cov_0.672952:7769-8092(+)